jgi:hypothetical protein
LSSIDSIGVDLLLLFRETCFHISISRFRNSAFAFGATLTCCLAGIHVSVKARWLSVSFVHFRGLLPLCPFRALFFEGDSLTRRPLLV